MKFTRSTLSLSFLLVFSPVLVAQDGGNEANKNLRSTIQKWVAVMKETQSKQKEWKEQQQILADSKASLEAENVQMESEILSAFARLSKTDASWKEKLDQKQRFDEGREELREGLTGLEERISAVIPLLPNELASQPKLEKAIVDHKNFVIRKDKEAIGLNSRLTAMLTILTEAEKFNQVVTPFSGKSAETGGQKILLDGIYFGLAMGFAANEDGTIAFRLVPGSEGWVEEELTDSEVIEDVRELIDVGNASGETRLVSVPLEIAE
ncbi:MAG: DUF3450 family protein [Verrucomicrobiaceae bacterium]|nr:DUF3450 family protein [Verrucomicrobiaceae bacterium]